MGKLLQDMSIGQNLQKLRTKAGMTQMAVVAQLQILGSKMDRTTYVKIENGVRNIKISDLVALKAIFNVPFDAFFEGLTVSKKK